MCQKIFASLSVIVILALAGCGGDKIVGDTTVSIERSVAKETDPRLLIKAGTVKLDYDQRRLSLADLSNIGGINHFGGGWVVERIEINSGGEVNIYIPTDAPYNIYINGQYHYLPEIKKAK